MTETQRIELAIPLLNAGGTACSVSQGKSSAALL